MPSSHRFVIAAGDPRHALSVQAHLRQALQLDAPVVRFEDVPHLLTPETDGDVLAFANDSTDAASIETVVREARIQQFPVGLSVVESETVRNLRLLDHLAPHLATRWIWPAQVRELTAWARRGLERGTPFADPHGESVHERIRRRMMNHTPSLTAMVEQLVIAAEHDVTVLLEGEPGTGKTYLAKLIHDSSPRRVHRFLGMPCGALSANHLAAELFGCTNGPDGAKPGKLAMAAEGTLLLDEIDTLTLEHQASLLRVLETGEYEPIGGNETLKCQARIIAASNWNLADAVERGAFRRDLYYQLHVVRFQLPPLRHRPEDIGPLVRGMVARYGTKFGKRLYSVSAEAQRALEAFPWPGNIRQLENVVQQAVLTSNGNELKLHHLSQVIHARSEGSSAAASGSAGFGGTLKQSRESSEKANILRALEKAGQSRTRAAQLLGVSRVTLYKKMKKYGLFTKIAVPFAVDGFANHVANGS